MCSVTQGDRGCGGSGTGPRGPYRECVAEQRPARTPLALAALACGAVKGLEPVSTQSQSDTDPDVDAALVEDSIGRLWVVRAPRTAAAGARMEAESRLIETLFGWVTFSVPRISGGAPLPEGGRALVHRAVTGKALDGDELAGSTTLTSAVGRALAAIHDLPTRLVADAGLPVYEADEYRQRRLAEVDRAAATGKVPPRLLARWEGALEEVGAWRFVPTVVHGELDGDTIRVYAGQLAGIVDWSQTRVADPADDFGWLANTTEPDTFEAVMATYTLRRRTAPDPDLPRRARLAGELGLVRWLLHGTTIGQEHVVSDAAAMLAALDATLEGETTW